MNSNTPTFVETSYMNTCPYCRKSCSRIA